MKIGIVTFHFAFNQGAVLQCYALQRYLESQGHEAYIIDYRPKYHTIMHSAWRNPFFYSKMFWKKFRNKRLLRRLYLLIRSFCRCMYWNITMIDRENQKVFQNFVGNHLNLTKEYQSLEQLQSVPPEMDVYISGSDQVWNLDLLGQEFDRAYFLDFGKKQTKRITYAVSMGMKHDEETLSQLRALCKGLDAISLREYSKDDVLAIGRDVHICIDPTFLLEPVDYSDIESKNVESSPYIFVYGFETNGLLYKALDEAVRKYKCRIINGSPKWLRINGDVERISGYGPDRFISLIKNAECVVTNSFHGTVFSIIFQKDFITIPHSTRGKRMEDLLEKFGLQFRLFGGREFSFEKEIDYQVVNNKIKKLASHSKEYLDLALKGKSSEEISLFFENER